MSFQWSVFIVSFLSFSPSSYCFLTRIICAIWLAFVWTIIFCNLRHDIILSISQCYLSRCICLISHPIVCFYFCANRQLSEFILCQSLLEKGMQKELTVNYLITFHAFIWSGVLFLYLVLGKDMCLNIGLLDIFYLRAQLICSHSSLFLSSL